MIFAGLFSFSNTVASTLISASPTMPMSSPWDLRSLIIHTKNEAHVVDIMQTVQDISNHPQLLQAFQDVAKIDKHMFKELSNTGFVYRRGLLTDLGNWKYTFLFQLISRFSKFKGLETQHWLDQMALRYSSLSLKATTTPKSLSMKGDVFEYALSLGRDTGPAVDSTTCSRRNEFNRVMNQFDASLEFLTKNIFHSGKGAPTVKEMLDPDMLAKVLYAYHACILTKNTRHSTERLNAFLDMTRPESLAYEPLFGVGQSPPDAPPRD